MSNKLLKAARVEKALKGIPKAQKPTWKRPTNGISKLHEVIFFAIKIDCAMGPWAGSLDLGTHRNYPRPY
jgi:hypothetical protein